MINVIIVENFINIAREICYKLLSFGVKGIPIQSRREALGWLEENSETNIAIVDVDNKSVEGFALIEDLYKKHGEKFRFVVHSAISMDDLSSKLAGKNVIGHVLKPYDEHRVDSSLKIIFSSLNFPDIDQRQHIRIVPDKGDMLRMNFRIKKYARIISGRIVNLSLGGLAVELLTPVNTDLLPERLIIPLLEFTVNAHHITTEGVVIFKRGKLIALRFHAFKDHNRQILAKYIYDRI